ncbi:MAG: glycosyltransferase, partial [Pyrinomonadaceae bacterium]
MPWSSIGGTEHATLRIIQSVARDFNNIVFCPEGENAVSEMFRAAGVDTVGYEIVEPSLRRPGGYLRASSRLAKELKRRKVDLVHCSDFLACCYSAVAGRMARLPVLCHVRNRFAEIPLRDRLVLSAVDKFVFVSQDTWRHFGYQVSANRGLVLYDGIDVRGEASSAEVRQEFGIPTATKIIGMVARVAPQKDYATLIKAAKLIVKEYPDVCFLIVGDYSKGENHKVHYAEVKRELDAFGMTPYFIFTDFREDVPRMIGAMDIFVLSTHLEGLPLVILEAMAQGKAVVATAVDGIPEVVVGGRT